MHQQLDQHPERSQDRGIAQPHEVTGELWAVDYLTRQLKDGNLNKTARFMHHIYSIFLECFTL